MQGHSPPVQVKEPYIYYETVTCRLILQKHCSVQYTPDLMISDWSSQYQKTDSLTISPPWVYDWTMASDTFKGGQMFFSLGDLLFLLQSDDCLAPK